MEKEIPKNPPGSASSDSEDSEEEVTTTKGFRGGTMTAAVLDTGVLQKRREKRLAMNRASARARRKRKKELLSSLAAQVQDLNEKNSKLQNKNDTLTARVEQLESALSQAQTTITTLSTGNQAMQNSLNNASAGVGQLNDVALRSLLLGAGSGLAGAGLGAAGLSSVLGDTLLNARAVQQLELQNQLRLLNATSGLGAASASAAGLGTGLGAASASAAGLGAGLGAATALQQQQAASDRLVGSLTGASGVGSLLGGGLGQGVPPSALQLDTLVRAKTMPQATEEKGTTDKTLSLQTGMEESASKMLGVAGIHDDTPASKKPRIL